jgi:hypothetical protein
MRMNRTARLVLAGVAAPALVVGAASSAFADSNNVHWKDKATGFCLGYYDTGATGLGTAVDTEACDDSGIGYTTWRDLQNSDGSWTERPAAASVGGGWLNLCLTADGHAVYLEVCEANNPWESWYEVHTANGWQLKNKRSGYLLDSNNAGGGRGTVYANPAYASDNYQLWM